MFSTYFSFFFLLKNFIFMKKKLFYIGVPSSVTLNCKNRKKINKSIYKDLLTIKRSEKSSIYFDFSNKEKYKIKINLTFQSYQCGTMRVFEHLLSH